MANRPKRRIPRGQCSGCRRSSGCYADHCPARDWQCKDCDMYGHLDGLCKEYSDKPISFDFPRRENAYQYGPLILEEGVLECGGCFQPYTNLHSKCIFRDWKCNVYGMYGHFDGLCKVYDGEVISFDFPLNEMMYMFSAKHKSSDWWLHPCPGCERPYTKLHICPARDWFCESCDMYGHIDGLCEVCSGDALSFDFPRNPSTYPYHPEAFKEISETMDRDASCENSYEGATLQDVKQEHHANPGMCNTRKRNAEHYEPCDIYPGQKHQRCTDPDKHELNFFKDPVEALRKENQSLKKKCESSKNTNNSVSTKKGRKKSNAKKTNSYKNSSTKTVDELIAELEKTKAEKMKLKLQRDQLFEYSQKLDAHNRKIATRVDHLTSDHRYVMDRAYPCWSHATLPPWGWSKGRCKRCGSSTRHEELDCFAKGHVCLHCDKFNHFTAVCRSAPSHTISSSLKELNLIAEVKADIAASK